MGVPRTNDDDIDTRLPRSHSKPIDERDHELFIFLHFKSFYLPMHIPWAPSLISPPLRLHLAFVLRLVSLHSIRNFVTLIRTWNSIRITTRRQMAIPSNPVIRRPMIQKQRSPPTAGRPTARSYRG
jgi:hypothetical protein